MPHTQDELDKIAKKEHIKQLRQAIYDCYIHIKKHKKRIKEIQEQENNE